MASMNNLNHLHASVGTGGDNQRDDVVRVQARLKQNGFNPGVTDGLCGPQTIAAIRAFQVRFRIHLDGLISPSGPTWPKLCARARGAAPTAAKVVTPNEWSGDSSKWSQEKKMLSMEPKFRGSVSSVVGSLSQKGFQPQIVFGWRSVAVQAKLVAAGKSKVRFSFHNAQKPDGTPSALAADIIDKRWSWGDSAEKNGFWNALGIV